MIKVRNIEVAFEGKNIFSGINLDVPESTTAVILGRNGCGKSVLLKCVAGLIKPATGDILLDEVNKDNTGEKKRVEIGYVFQKGGLFDSMSVYDNIAFALRRRNIAEIEIQRKAIEALKKVGLFDVETRFPQELSGGMQKRVSLARSLCMEPTHMIYDDPTAGLDPVLTDSIAELLNDIRNVKRVTSLVVTHDLTLVEKVADSVHLLYNGEMVFSGTKTAFFNNGNEYTDQFIKGELDGPFSAF
ncbi:MAG TPA: ATP-binding cassette domain-containing protein [Spirochaetota bacterium]|nr:ATP-binding cassette domain-containing protein [Spirochaetota bacterium]